MQERDKSCSGTLWSTAHEFYEVANLVIKNKPPQMHYPIVEYSLICHSIEASLKGFLRAKGYTIRQLRDIGHDLERALNTARAEGIESYCRLSADFLRDLATANFSYKHKDFDYLLSGTVSLPKDAELLLSGAGLLVLKLRQFCVEKMYEHDGKESAHDPAAQTQP